MKNIDLDNLRAKTHLIKQGDIVISEHHSNTLGSGSLHTHSCYELEILIAGQSVVMLNSKTYSVGPGHFWLSFPNGLHQLPASGIGQLISIKFREEILSRELFLLLHLVSGNLCGRMTDGELEQWYREFRDTVNACSKIQTDAICSLYLKNKLESWLLQMLDLSCDLQTVETTSVLSDERLYQVVTYIKNHFRENISVQEVSRIFNYTPNYFSSKFKNLFGRSFTEFVNDERLRLSYHLLESSDMTIHQVAEYVGYDSVSYFHKIFKEKFSKTPNEIRINSTKL